MSTKELTKKIRELENRLKILESRPTTLYSRENSFKKNILARSSVAREYEKEKWEIALQNSSGILKGKFKDNPVQWQRKIRKDRSLKQA